MTLVKDSVQDCMDFFRKGYPVSGPKNVRTQLGVVFEEFHEMLSQIDPENVQDKMLFSYLGQAIQQASEHLKTSEGTLNIKDRVEFLDGLCDLMVTAVGLGHHTKLNVPDAFKEVNRSNNSKFGENGEPILDNNLKMIKGPNYSKPDLKSFV